MPGPSLDFAVAQGFGFIPLRGERDIQHDIGLTVPVRGWALESDNFHTSARNFLDHDVIGDSGIFIPLTDLGAIISGTEVTVRSPRLFRVAQWRVAYSNQIAQGIGPITGGLTRIRSRRQFPAGSRSAQYRDFGALFESARPHVGDAGLPVRLRLPERRWSGAPAAALHLRSLHRQELRRELVGFRNAVNIANTRYLLDTSNTFGGTHYINPRQIYGEIRYRFHF